MLGWLKVGLVAILIMIIPLWLWWRWRKTQGDVENE